MSDTNRMDERLDLRISSFFVMGFQFFRQMCVTNRTRDQYKFFFSFNNGGTEKFYS